jgi:hypothetical protein
MGEYRKLFHENVSLSGHRFFIGIKPRITLRLPYFWSCFPCLKLETTHPKWFDSIENSAALAAAPKRYFKLYLWLSWKLQQNSGR